MIYKFEPILKTLVWGTENWVLSGVKGNETRVAEGPAKGKTLNELYGEEFPLLIKFIDAKKDLSIQVHPNDEIAQQRHGCRGKTEMWYIIGAAPGAHLLAGLSKAITPDDYVRLVAEGRITEVLADHKVAPGDVFFLPAGRIHAICGGCYLAEIQETSDITCNHRPDVRIAQIAYRDRHWQRQQQRDAQKQPPCQKLAHDGLFRGKRQREQQLQRAHAALFRPHAHADGGNEQHIQPWMPHEETGQRRFVRLEETAHHKREETRQNQEDNQKNIRNRRSEIARQLAFDDMQSLVHFHHSFISHSRCRDS